jgi:ATP-dependent RNA helicase DDX56/DBP9
MITMAGGRTAALDPSVTFPALCDSVGLDVRLKKAVSRLGHVRPTLVQAKCLPLAICDGRDLLVR